MSAAGLGVNTSNTNQALAEGLAGLTQGLVQGMKLRYLNEQAAREQATYEREDNERKAAQRGLGLLAGEAGYQPPDNTADTAHGVSQIQAGADAVKEATAGTPIAFMGDMLSRGAASSSKPLGQALDWQALKRHQADFMSKVQAEVAGMDPRVGAQILDAAKQGMAEDAMLLHRSHAVSQGHDDLVSGAYDVFTPDGQVLRDPAMVKSISNMLTQVEQGIITPEQFEARVGPLREQAHASWVENKQRFYRAQSAQKDLDALAATGAKLPDAAVAAQHRFATGRYDPKQFDSDWPHILKGEVLYDGEWEMPQVVEKLKKLKEQTAQSAADAQAALAEERRQSAYAKSPMGQAREFMYQRALEKAKGDRASADHWRESFNDAMKSPGRSISEATEIANVATGLKVALPANGTVGAGAPPPAGDGTPAPAPFDAEAAVQSLRAVPPAQQQVSIGAIAAKYGDAAALSVIKALGMTGGAPSKKDERGAAFERLLADPSQALKGVFEQSYGNLSDEESKAYWEKQVGADNAAKEQKARAAEQEKKNDAEFDAERKAMADEKDNDSRHALEYKWMKKYGANKAQLNLFMEGRWKPQPK